MVRIVLASLLVVLAFSGGSAEPAFPVLATNPPVDPGAPKPDPRPDPFGCRKACGSKSCCIARTPLSTLLRNRVRGGMTPIPDDFIGVRDFHCPRIDIVSLGGHVSALNVNGFTIGHLNNIQLRRKDGTSASFESGQLAYLPKFEGELPPRTCAKDATMNIVVDPASGSLSIGDEVVGTFDSFALTRQSQEEKALFAALLDDRGVKTRRFGSGGKFSATFGPVPGSLGQGSGGPPNLGGPSPDPPKTYCNTGQGRMCPD